MTALDTARLMWLINGTSDKEQVLWKKLNGKPVTAAELSDSSRKFLKGLLAQQGFNTATTSLLFSQILGIGTLIRSLPIAPAILTLMQ